MATPRQLARRAVREIFKDIRETLLAYESQPSEATAAAVIGVHPTIAALPETLGDRVRHVSSDQEHLLLSSLRAIDALRGDGSDALVAVGVLRLSVWAFGRGERFQPPARAEERRQFDVILRDVAIEARNVERSPGRPSSVGMARSIVGLLNGINSWPASLENDAKVLQLLARRLSDAMEQQAGEPTVTQLAQEVAGAASEFGSTTEVGSSYDLSEVIQRLDVGPDVDYGADRSDEADWAKLTGLSEGELDKVRAAMRAGRLRVTGSATAFLDDVAARASSGVDRGRTELASGLRHSFVLPDVPDVITSVGELFPVLRGMGSRQSPLLRMSEERMWLESVRSALVDEVDLAVPSIAPEWKRFRLILDEQLTRGFRRSPESQSVLLDAAKTLATAVTNCEVDELVALDAAVRLRSVHGEVERGRRTRAREPRQNLIEIAASGPRSKSELAALMRGFRNSSTRSRPPRTRLHGDHRGHPSDVTRFWQAYPPIPEDGPGFDLSRGVGRGGSAIMTSGPLRRILQASDAVSAYPTLRQQALVRAAVDVVPTPATIRRFGTGTDSFNAAYTAFWLGAVGVARGEQGVDLGGFAGDLADEIDSRGVDVPLFRPAVMAVGRPEVGSLVESGLGL